MAKTCKNCNKEHNDAHKYLCHNCYMKQYHEKNKNKLNAYMRERNKSNKKPFVYLVIYPDGLYIGSTYWPSQRRSVHVNSITDKKYNQYIQKTKAINHYEYALPVDTPIRYTRLLEGFLIYKLSPEINIKHMTKNFTFTIDEIPLMLQADIDSNKIIEWAKNIDDLLPFITK